MSKYKNKRKGKNGKESKTRIDTEMLEKLYDDDKGCWKKKRISKRK